MIDPNGNYRPSPAVQVLFFGALLTIGVSLTVAMVKALGGE